MKPYKLRLGQAIKADDKQTRKQFCVNMQEKLEEAEFYEHLLFSDEATFHTNVTVYDIIFVCGAKKISMPLLSMRGTH